LTFAILAHMENAVPSTVEVNFALDIGPSRLDASAVVPAGETNLTQMLPVLQDLSSNIINATVQIAENEGQSISCRAGCGACCRQLVPLSIFEAQVLADWIHTLPAERQSELAARFDAALMQLESSGILPRLDPSVRSQDRTESRALALEYLRLRVPCPFLENESCSIHPIRPVICREYLVTSPPANCVDPTVFPVVGVPQQLKFSHVLANLGAQVDPPSGGWMPLVFLFAWIRAGKGDPGKAVTGTGPDLLYGIIQRLAKSSEADAVAAEGSEA